jgi:4-carboxymuconolactone decarboxylase
MRSVIQTLRSAAGAIAVAGLLSFQLSTQAQAEERLSELRLDQLSADQQKMATMLSTPPRNSRINGGPFNAYARSPALGVLLLQVSDFVRFNTSLAPRLSEFAIMITARQWSQLYEWRSHYPSPSKAASIGRFSSIWAPANDPKA